MADPAWREVARVLTGSAPYRALRQGRGDVVRLPVPAAAWVGELLAAVGRATGVDMPPSGDHELGRLALALNEIKRAEGGADVPTLVAVLEEELIPSVLRLAPAFPMLEARVAASA